LAVDVTLVSPTTVGVPPSGSGITLVPISARADWPLAVAVLAVDPVVPVIVALAPPPVAGALLLSDSVIDARLDAPLAMAVLFWAWVIVAWLPEPVALAVSFLSPTLVSAVALAPLAIATLC